MQIGRNRELVRVSDSRAMQRILQSCMETSPDFGALVEKAKERNLEWDGNRVSLYELLSVPLATRWKIEREIVGSARLPGGLEDAVIKYNLATGAVLKSTLRAATATATNYAMVCTSVMNVVRELSQSFGRVGFVAGMISSDGEAFVGRNIATLDRYTDYIRSITEYPVISAADVFHRELLEKYRSKSKEEWCGFWRRVLGSGVTDLFMTPRWEASVGANDEHEFAKRLGIRIHYVQDNPELVQILKLHRR